MFKTMLLARAKAALATGQLVQLRQVVELLESAKAHLSESDVITITNEIRAQQGNFSPAAQLFLNNIFAWQKNAHKQSEEGRAANAQILREAISNRNLSNGELAQFFTALGVTQEGEWGAQINGWMQQKSLSGQRPQSLAQLHQGAHAPVLSGEQEAILAHIKKSDDSASYQRYFDAIDTCADRLKELSQPAAAGEAPSGKSGWWTALLANFTLVRPEKIAPPSRTDIYRDILTAFDLAGEKHFSVLQFMQGMAVKYSLNEAQYQEVAKIALQAAMLRRRSRLLNVQSLAQENPALFAAEVAMIAGVREFTEDEKKAMQVSPDDLTSLGNMGAKASNLWVSLIEEYLGSQALPEDSGAGSVREMLRRIQDELLLSAPLSAVAETFTAAGRGQKEQLAPESREQNINASVAAIQTLLDAGQKAAISGGYLAEGGGHATFSEFTRTPDKKYLIWRHYNAGMGWDTDSERTVREYLIPVEHEKAFLTDLQKVMSSYHSDKTGEQVMIMINQLPMSKDGNGNPKYNGMLLAAADAEYKKLSITCNGSGQTTGNCSVRSPQEFIKGQFHEWGRLNKGHWQMGQREYEGFLIFAIKTLKVLVSAVVVHRG